jgi:hypothetical protein
MHRFIETKEQIKTHQHDFAPVQNPQEAFVSVQFDYVSVQNAFRFLTKDVESVYALFALVQNSQVHLVPVQEDYIWVQNTLRIFYISKAPIYKLYASIQEFWNSLTSSFLCLQQFKTSVFRTINLFDVLLQNH